MVQITNLVPFEFEEVRLVLEVKTVGSGGVYLRLVVEKPVHLYR
jgi:hypothetical protein